MRKPAGQSGPSLKRLKVVLPHHLNLDHFDRNRAKVAGLNLRPGNLAILCRRTKHVRAGARVVLTPTGLSSCPVSLDRAYPSREYRTQARECAERAKLSRDPETKRQYEDMARQWLELAKRAEKLG